MEYIGYLNYYVFININVLKVIMNFFKILSISFFAVFLSACVSNKATVNFDINSQIDISNYKTFAWLNDDKVLTPTIDFNPVMKARIDSAIEAAFISKGYQLITVQEDADFTISYSVGNREKIKVRSYPATYGGSFMWGQRYHSSRQYDMMMSDSVKVTQYEEGKLAIDIYDVKSHQPVWHGWATKQLTEEDKKNPSDTIQKLVAEVLAQF